eukprot:TRINITY_DN19444_c0_g1_i1.p1 TRINITY_DN19444_c0_g1~~TRINITY_DN19444_c0_g1_i1.p1  ORF type:complete len:120 (-),score=21.42 TRINITY_DN19444_c0_g1_i1:59-418(-)
MEGNMSFKLTNTLKKRTSISSKLLASHPDKIPIIVERQPNSDAPPIPKHKFLAPGDLTVAGFISEIRKQLPIGSETAIFIFVNQNTLPASSALLSTIYEQHKDEDGFLYILYTKENIYG